MILFYDPLNGNTCSIPLILNLNQGDENFYLLFETATGFCLFQRLFGEEIGEQSKEYQESLAEASKFKKLFKLKKFGPFTSAEEALDSINSVSEGDCIL